MTTVPTIAGDRSLPPPFDHPHASARARAIAERGTVLRAQQKDPVLMYALRLGLPGVELLTTGRITLPVPEPDRSYLRRVRLREVPLAEVVAAVEDAEARLLALRGSPAVPPAPEHPWVDGRLHRSYLAHWETR